MRDIDTNKTPLLSRRVDGGAVAWHTRRHAHTHETTETCGARKQAAHSPLWIVGEVREGCKSQKRERVTTNRTNSNRTNGGEKNADSALFRESATVGVDTIDLDASKCVQTLK